MANRTATIWMSATVAGKWGRFKPVVGKNNKMRPGVCLVNGQEYHDPAGVYYVGYYQGGKQRWEKVGPNPQDAVYAQERREMYLQADNAGLVVVDPAANNKLSLAAAVDGYLKEIEKDIVRGKKSQATLQLFTKTLAEFQAGCRRVYVQDITREDMIDYQDALLRRGLTKNTAGKNLRRASVFHFGHTVV